MPVSKLSDVKIPEGTILRERGADGPIIRIVVKAELIDWIGSRKWRMSLRSATPDEIVLSDVMQT